MKRLLACVLLVAAGCSKPETPAPSPSAPEAPSAPAPPAASSLPLLRGVVVLSAEAPRLTPCGETTPVVLRDETRGALAEAYGQLASEQTGEMWVEVRAERDAAGIAAREVVRASPIGEGDPCSSAPAPGEIRAFGNEPFWSITVTPAGLELSRPDLPAPLVFPLSAPATQSASRTWKSELAGPPAHRIELVVGPARCKDGMSGAWFALAAEAVVDGQALAGCAVAGE